MRYQCLNVYEFESSNPLVGLEAITCGRSHSRYLCHFTVETRYDGGPAGVPIEVKQGRLKRSSGTCASQDEVFRDWPICTTATGLRGTLLATMRKAAHAWWWPVWIRTSSGPQLPAAVGRVANVQSPSWRAAGTRAVLLLWRIRAASADARAGHRRCLLRSARGACARYRSATRVFCAWLLSLTDHPACPPDYVPLDAFWTRRGFTRRPDSSAGWHGRKSAQSMKPSMTRVLDEILRGAPAMTRFGSGCCNTRSRPRQALIASTPGSTARGRGRRGRRLATGAAGVCLHGSRRRICRRGRPARELRAVCDVRDDCSASSSQRRGGTCVAAAWVDAWAEGGRVRNRAPLIAPDGTLAFQDKSVMTGSKPSRGASRPAPPSVFDTPWLARDRDLL